MKKICVSLILTAAVFTSFCQVQNPGFQNMLSRDMNENGQNFYRNVSIFQLDSNEQYKSIRDGFILGRAVKTRQKRKLYEPDRSLKNEHCHTDVFGRIKMTNGSTPLLKENDFVDLDGNVKTVTKMTKVINLFNL